MSFLRHVLVVLLCLSVPTAGWASVVGPLMGSEHLATHSHGHHHETPHAHTTGVRAGAHLGAIEQQHVAQQSKGGCPSKKCQDRCACGCGMGACSAGSAIGFDASLGIRYFGLSAEIPPPPEPHFLGARGTSPLRPPIS